MLFGIGRKSFPLQTGHLQTDHIRTDHTRTDHTRTDHTRTGHFTATVSCMSFDHWAAFTAATILVLIIPVPWVK